MLLTHKHLGMHGLELSTVATDALVLKQQAINIQSTDKLWIVFHQFHIRHITYTVNNIKK